MIRIQSTLIFSSTDFTHLHSAAYKPAYKSEAE